MKTIANALILVMVALGVLIGVGTIAITPSPSGYGVSVQSDWATVQRVREEQRTQRARVEADTQIAITKEREATARVLWPVVAFCATAAIVGVAWSRRPHRPVPPPMLLTYLANHYLPGQAGVEQVDGEWFVVDHTARAIIRADRLIG